jgi:hypothetical protein
MKLLLYVLLFLATTGSFVSADTIHLKDGRSIEGKIVLRDKNQIQIDVKGLTMTYYHDEIKDVNGLPLSNTTPTPAITATKIPVTPASNAPAAPVKVSPAEKRALILKFIDVFGTKKAMERNFESMVNSLAQQKPEQAVQIREKFKVDDIIERLIPSYDKYFTAEELKTYIEFYGSASGQKLISNIGLVMRDSIQIGEAYLKEKFPELDEK